MFLPLRKVKKKLKFFFEVIQLLIKLKQLKKFYHYTL